MSFADELRRINPDEYKKQEEELRKQKEKEEYEKKFHDSLNYWKQILTIMLTKGKQNNLFANNVSGVFCYNNSEERIIFYPCNKQWLYKLKNPYKSKESMLVVSYKWSIGASVHNYPLHYLDYELRDKKYTNDFTIAVISTALEDLGFLNVRAEIVPAPYYHEVDGFIFPHYVKDMKEIALYSFSC